MIIVAVMLPEVSAFFRDADRSWVIYLTGVELVKALLCLVLAQFVPAFRTVGLAASIWFVTQAADEMTNGNLWANDLWEYGVLAVSAFALWLNEKMKTMKVAEIVKEVIGGTPAEVGVKILLAAGVAFWNNLTAISLGVFGYAILLVVDAIFGAMLATRAGIRFRFSKFIKGPSFKLAITAMAFVCASVIDTMLPDKSWMPTSAIFGTTAVFIMVTQFMDALKKYATLSGSMVANFLERILGTVVKYEEKKAE